jgi:hypothetical protein
VGGFVLTAAGQQAPIPVSLTGNHVFWTGVALALLVSFFLPMWLRGILFVVALLASDLLHGHFTSAELLTLLLAVAGLVIGLWIGRSRGLRLLGEAEFRTRWRNVLGISRWF